MILLENQKTNTTSDQYTVQGGNVYFQIEGVFDGALVQIEARAAGNSDYYPLDDALKSTPDFFFGVLPQSTVVRAVLSSAGASTDITVTVTQ